MLAIMSVKSQSAIYRLVDRLVLRITKKPASAGFLLVDKYIELTYNKYYYEQIRKMV